MATTLVHYFKEGLSRLEGVVSNCSKEDSEEKDKRIETIESYKRLINLGVHRTILKKSIMTIPYNIGDMECVKYMKEHFIQCEKD